MSTIQTIGEIKMIVSEKEALKRWCPFARVLAMDEKTMYVGYNRCVVSGEETATKVAIESVWARCIGSECMAWRRSPTPVDLTRGYCGLAGATP